MSQVDEDKVLDEAGGVSGRQRSAPLVRGLAEVAPWQARPLRETPADKTGRGPAAQEAPGHSGDREKAGGGSRWIRLQ